MDIVEKVASEIADIPGDPSSLEIARIAIEAYQRALWPTAFDARERFRIMPELRRNRAYQLTSHIMNIVGKYLCDHGDVHGHRDASRDLMETIYESGAYIVTDADRATAGLLPRGPSGLTLQELRIMELRHTEAMLSTVPPVVIPVRPVA